MKDEKIYLKHIQEAIRKIEQYTKGMSYGDFFENSLVEDAVIRELQVIGEAAIHLSKDLKKKIPAIEWENIIGMRNKLIHEYFGVDIDIVWTTVQQYLPRLKDAIKKYFSKK